MKNFDLRAVIVGLAIDVGGSVLVGLLISLIIYLIVRNEGNMLTTLFFRLKTSPPIELLGLVCTTLCDGIGGYVAARMSSRERGTTNAFAVGVLSTLLGALFVAFHPGVVPAWKVWIGIIVTIPASLVGGRLAVRA